MAPSIDDLISRQQELYTRIANSVENLKKLGAASITIGAVESRIQLLENNWKKFEDLHEQILSSATEAHKKLPYFQDNSFELTEEMFVTRQGNFRDILRDLQSPEPSTSAPVQPHLDVSRSRTALPRIQLPKFDGKYTEWTSFRDLFSSLVINDFSLTNVERLMYLKTSVSGEASNLLKNIATTDANFEHAWSVLVNRFENKRLLVTSQLGALSNIESMKSESAGELKRVLDTTRDIVSALATLQCPITNGTYWLAHITAERLDKRSRRDWETSLGSCLDPPTFDQLHGFLEERLHALEAIENAGPPMDHTGSKTKNASDLRWRDRKANQQAARSHHATKATKSSPRCSICTRDHFTRLCPEYEPTSPAQKRTIVDQRGLCLNCLGKHRLKECKSSFRCKHCSNQHHTTLHEPLVGNATKPTATTSVTSAHVAGIQPESASSVLLATSRVRVIGDNGETTEARALIDPGSEISFVSETLAQRLRLQRDQASLPVIGVGSKVAHVARGRVSCQVTSVHRESPHLRIEAFVLPRLSAYRPRCSVVSPIWPHVEGLTLADPRYTAVDAIDLLLGADVYAAVMLPGLRRGPKDTPVAQETIFGWVLSGKTSTTTPKPAEVGAHHCSVLSDASLTMEIQRFWEQEEVSVPSPLLTEDEKACEEHFCATHSRQSDGRYVVRLPLKRPPTDLGESRRTALRTLSSVERRFKRQPNFANLYCNFMYEYEELGHMQRCSGQPIGPVFYLPHHGLLKDGGKIRVVFNGSCATTSGASLNDLQHTGPKLLRDLCEVLHRWRRHQFVFTADIKKMYRQIRVHPDDWDLQRIVWRRSADNNPVDYYLTTVTYGQAAAPYLAIRTLHQLAQDEEHRFPLAADILVRDSYVDDILSGASSIQKAAALASELVELCKAGGFPLSKWASNSPEVIQSLPGEQANGFLFEWPETSERTVLGLEWSPSLDHFSYRVAILQPTSAATKRGVLSMIARLFDPLGWLAPVIVKAKIFLQSLWLLKIGWDDTLPQRETNLWLEFQEDLDAIRSITIPRWLGTTPASLVQIYGFVDASERAYAAVVYLRIVNENENPIVRLVAAKTRVAPVKQLALPRLELCAATLLTRLTKVVRDVLGLHLSSAHLHSDSTIVLGWIRSHPSRWKTYVANRVAEIQITEPSAHWRHVASSDNPADCASRGLRAVHLSRHSLWWSGPRWLVDGLPEQAGESDQESGDIELEARTTHHASATDSRVDELDNSLLLRFSSWHRLLRVTAWCLRCRQIHIRLRQSTPSTDTWCPGVLRPGDLAEARTRWVLDVQRRHFKDELTALRSGRALPVKSSLIRLSPILDDQGQLRVGGRLKHAILSYDERHPIILPSTSHFSLLVAEATHRPTLHGGVQLSLTTLRRSFWILKGRRVMKTVIHRCLQCLRWRAAVPRQVMASLPPSRVQPSRPFTHCGVDYAGPIQLRTSPGRGTKSYKGYIAIFVFLATRAVHLEVVSAYTTEAFLAAYRRFSSRRGLPAIMYSDCGTTFTGADAELRSMFRAASATSRSIATTLANDGTEWRFNPPAAPHFGGLWEAAVKSVKHHLRRVIGEATLTFEEMNTLLTQIEACLNSRPLQPNSDDPDDLSSLTPGHFLVGSPLTVVPEPSLLDLQLSRLSRWQLIQQMLQSFWRRWSNEYIVALQGRGKWTRVQPNFKVGDLCLLRNELQPPSKWPLARVTAVHPGDDGHVRVVTLRTASSTAIKRPIVKVVRLELASE